MKQTISRRWRQILFIGVDVLATEIVWLAFLGFRWLVLDHRMEDLFDFWSPAFDFSIHSSFMPFALYPLGCLVIYYLSGYYLRPGKERYSSLIQTTMVSSLIITLGAFFCIILDDITTITEVSRYYISIMVLFVLQFGIVLILRSVLHSLFHNYIHCERIVLSQENGMSEMELYKRIGELYPTDKEIVVLPRTQDVLFGAVSIQHLDDSPMIVITDLTLSDSGIAVKRAFDFLLAIVLLILCLPLALCIAIGIVIDSRGPVFYTQERIGLNGRPFRILKFRTMYPNAESDTPCLASEKDKRITRFGRLLRKYRLDEMPQFINIIRGEMSFVGPRPERPYFIDLIMQQAPYYCLLYKVRPGLTSWGPIKVGYTNTMDKMIQRLHYDLTYIENMSLSLDIRILLRTIIVLLKGEGQ